MDNSPLVYAPLSQAQLAERWRELLHQPGLPDRFEIDEFGELIEMNPAQTPHQRIVAALMKQIEQHLGGESAAYLAAGAREVIIVETSGRIRYFGSEGELPQSALGLRLALPAGTYPL